MKSSLSPLTVAFTGHRPEKMPFPEDPQNEMYRRFRAAEARTIRLLLGRGYTRFISGMARGFDLWTAEDVLALKARHPEVSLMCAVPFPGQANGWPSADRERWQFVLDCADEVVTTSPGYSSGCFFIRNRFMVDRADVIVGAYTTLTGGTGQTVRYALGQGKTVLCIDPETGDVRAENTST